MKTRDFFCKTLPAFMAAVFLIGAFTVFTLKYAFPGTVLPPIFESAENINKLLFFLNFYIPFAASALCLFCCIYLTGFYIRGFCLITGLSAAVISCYFLNDFFTINLCIYSANIVMAAMAFNPPRNYFISAFALIFFAIFLFYPTSLGFVFGGI